MNSVWGTVCGHMFGSRDAHVACRKLGYAGEGKVSREMILYRCLNACFSASTAFLRAEFGEGSGLVYLEGLECVGDEDSLLDCPMQLELGHSLCDHSSDAGIRCYGKVFLQPNALEEYVLIFSFRY